MARWEPLHNTNEESLAFWLEQLRGDALNAPLFANKGLKSIDDASRYLHPVLEGMHDPFLMKDMEKAALRLQQAILDKQRILVYGDYDVDGTTSVAMMVDFLRGLQQEASYYIPDRFKEGYGLSQQGANYAIEQQFDLLIALDCGIKSVALAAQLQQAGVDLIICDHHNPGDIIPPAFAVLDPKQADCAYPYKGLSGCGVGFKLIQAVCMLMEMDDAHWLKMMDLLTVSIACDLVPLTGENRVMAAYGLEMIGGAHGGPRPGLKTLLQLNEQTNLINSRRWTITDLVFNVGPKINAAGRMQHARTAVELLLSNKNEDANTLVADLNLQNEERKSADATTTAEALAQLEQMPGQDDRSSQVVFQPHWPKGVVGIVASRLIERHYKPTVVLTKHEDKISGSARSVEGFDLYDALLECKDHMIQFGGHAHAAGMTLRPEQLEGFREAFESAVSKRIEPWQKEVRFLFDAEIKLSDIQKKRIERMEKLGPFGPDNMRPVFLCRAVRDVGTSQLMGADGSHLRLSIMQENHPVVFYGQAFKLGHWYNHIREGKPFDILFSIERSWFGISDPDSQGKIVLDIKDIKAHT